MKYILRGLQHNMKIDDAGQLIKNSFVLYLESARPMESTRTSICKGSKTTDIWTGMEACSSMEVGKTYDMDIEPVTYKGQTKMKLVSFELIE